MNKGQHENISEKSSQFGVIMCGGYVLDEVRRSCFSVLSSVLDHSVDIITGGLHQSKELKKNFIEKEYVKYHNESKTIDNARLVLANTKINSD